MLRSMLPKVIAAIRMINKVPRKGVKATIFKRMNANNVVPDFRQKVQFRPPKYSAQLVITTELITVAISKDVTYISIVSMARGKPITVRKRTADSMGIPMKNNMPYNVDFNGALTTQAPDLTNTAGNK